MKITATEGAFYPTTFEGDYTAFREAWRTQSSDEHPSAERGLRRIYKGLDNQIDPATESRANLEEGYEVLAKGKAGILVTAVGPNSRPHRPLVGARDFPITAGGTN